MARLTKCFLVTLLSLFAPLFCYYPGLDDNPLIDKKMKEMIKPHLLPLDHPLKPILDTIFSGQRVVENEESIRNAGFSMIAIQRHTHIIVARHPLAPGYVYKMYRDEIPNGRKNIPGWQCLVERCVNAKETKKFIKKNKLRYFSVPNKWLYILPLESTPLEKTHQPILLIANDMEIEDEETAALIWKTNATPFLLNELYILFKGGYGSYNLPKNMPYSKHGTFALIDTEKPRRKIKLNLFDQYFSEEMKEYWHRLIQ